MADIFDKKMRSKVMSKIPSKRNKSTELKLISIFNTYGIHGWRRNYPARGKPDFVFLSKKVAIFVDGCFWHGHDCRNTRPKENAEFWQAKRAKNIARDKQVNEMFKNRGWTVIRIWECELNKNLFLEKLNILLSAS